MKKNITIVVTLLVSSFVWADVKPEIQVSSSPVDLTKANVSGAETKAALPKAATRRVRRRKVILSLFVVAQSGLLVRNIFDEVKKQQGDEKNLLLITARATARTVEYDFAIISVLASRIAFSIHRALNLSMADITNKVKNGREAFNRWFTLGEKKEQDANVEQEKQVGKNT